MSALQYQHIASDGHIPTNQKMGPITGSIDHYPFEEEFLQSISFDTAYNDNWLADLQNMQPNGQIHPTSVDYSLNNPPNMESAGQFTEAFVDSSLNMPTQMQSDWQYPEAFGDQSLNILTYMQPAGQPTLNFLNQSSNTSTNMQNIGQPTTSLTNQSSYDPTNTHPLEQHTQAPINYGGNMAANVPPDGQATQPTIHHSGNPQTITPLDGQATPAPVPSSGNGNKKTRTTRKPSPVSTKGKVKDPAVVEDKEIERCAREYDISYDETRILLDHANARLKGIETSEPKDAPSQYIISRFEQVRRTHPDHATWPYDIPEEKIIRLLPGQKKQSRAPHKSYQGACEKRREELDLRYTESRQWHGPPPPKPGETHQNTLIDPAVDSIASGSTPPSNFLPAEAALDNSVTELTPPGNWNFDPAEVAANTIATGSTPSWNWNFDSAELANDIIATGLTTPGNWNFDSAEVATNNIATGLTPPPNFDSAEVAIDEFALGFPSSWHFDSPEEAEAFTKMLQDSVDSFDNTTSAASFDFGMESIEGSIQHSLPPSFIPPTQPDGLDPINYLANGPTAPEGIRMAGSGESAQFPSLLPTFTSREQDSGDLLDNPNQPAFFDPNQFNYPLPPPTFTPGEQNSAGPLENSNPSAESNVKDFDSLFDEEEEHPSPPPTFAPVEQDDKNHLANSNPPAVFDQSQLDYPFEDTAQLIAGGEMGNHPQELPQHPPELPTFAPLEQDITNPLDNVYLPAISDNSQIDSIFDKEVQLMNDSEFNALMESLCGGSEEVGGEGLEKET